MHYRSNYRYRRHRGRRYSRAAQAERVLATVGRGGYKAVRAGYGVAKTGYGAAKKVYGAAKFGYRTGKRVYRLAKFGYRLGRGFVHSLRHRG